MVIRSPLSRSLLLAILVAALAAGIPGTALAETRPHYDIQAALDFGNATLDVVQKTTLRNSTGVDLPELVFQVVPAYFGAFTLQSTQVDGRETAASMNGTVLELKLNSPLAAGATAQAELRYRLKVPPIGGRFGHGEGILALGNWFPVLAVYQNGWDRHQYVDVGDAFYTEVADFDVAVTSDVPVTVASSGQQVQQQGRLQSFRAEMVRDFAMAISDQYQVRARDVDGVRVTAYASSAARLEVYLDEAARALRWYSANLGAYPYPTLDIAEIHAPDFATAQEYPALIFVYKALGADGGGVGSYSDYTVAHEAAHQWFYSAVGNDQVHDPWLDEAFASYLSILPYRESSPRHFDYYFDRMVAGYRARAAAGGDRPVNTTIYDYPSDVPYFDIVYRKGAMFLDELRGLMGADRFLALLRDYVESYSGKVATPRAFLDMAYARVGSGLPPLVARYFSYGAFADGKGYRLEIKWPGELADSGPVELSYRADFKADRTEIWLDNRLLHRGTGDTPISFSMDGVEAGEHILRLDLQDAQGTLYQQARRVEVVHREVPTPAGATASGAESIPSEGGQAHPPPQEEQRTAAPLSPWQWLRAMEREYYASCSTL